jgi:hypothetical protein
MLCALINIEGQAKQLLEQRQEKAKGGDGVETAGMDESGAGHLAHAIAFCFATSV